MPYLLASHILLTLSGVRACGTSSTLEGLNINNMKGLQTFLAKHNFTLLSEYSEYEEPFDTDVYYLINHKAMNAIPDNIILKIGLPLSPPILLNE